MFVKWQASSNSSLKICFFTVSLLFRTNLLEWLLSFHPEHVTLLREEAFVEEHRRQVGEEQDGSNGWQHGDGPYWSILDQNSIFKDTSWEAENHWQSQWCVSTQQSQHWSHHTAYHCSITIGDVEEDNAEQLREDHDVGHFSSEKPEQQGAFGHVGQ